jgi:hypothetical protein
MSTEQERATRARDLESKAVKVIGALLADPSGVEPQSLDLLENKLLALVRALRIARGKIK